jgi:hypothetical protein
MRLCGGDCAEDHAALYGRRLQCSMRRMLPLRRGDAWVALRDRTVGMVAGDLSDAQNASRLALAALEVTLFL